MDKTAAAVALAGMAVGFGAFAMYLGYDSVLISSVFGFLGLIGGYIFGKTTETKQDTEGEAS